MSEDKNKSIDFCSDKLIDNSLKRSESNENDNKLLLEKKIRFSTIDDEIENCYGFFINHLSIRPVNKSNNIKTITLASILSEKNGTIIQSIHFSFIYNLKWLLEQYPLHLRKKPIDIVCGDQSGCFNELQNESKLYSNVRLCPIKIAHRYSCHHSKIMILRYDDFSIRIIILTANMLPLEWNSYTQGIWISPKLKNRLSMDLSKTKFKTDFIEYLKSYNNIRINKWIELISEYDFSPINVYLIASSPNSTKNIDSFGHFKLRKILKNSEYSPTDEVKTWPIVCQFSSIGSLGLTRESWLTSEFFESISAFNDNNNNNNNNSNDKSKSEIKCIYPTKSAILNSIDKTGHSFPYRKSTSIRQPYLKEYFHHFHSIDELNRHDVMPHIKSYTRISNDNKRISWFLMTSANLSKAAWGFHPDIISKFRMNNYEIGVLFLPKLLINENSFNVDSFPIYYKLPLIKYNDDDEPWTNDAY